MATAVDFRKFRTKSNVEAPCRDCAERHYNCHGSCRKYLAFRAVVDERNARRASLREGNPERGKLLTEIKWRKERAMKR